MDDRAFDRMIEQLQRDNDTPTLRQIVAALAFGAGSLPEIRPFTPLQCASLARSCSRKRCCHRARCEQSRCRCAGNDKPCGASCIRRDRCCRDENCPAGTRCGANHECVGTASPTLPLAQLATASSARIRRLPASPR